MSWRGWAAMSVGRSQFPGAEVRGPGRRLRGAGIRGQPYPPSATGLTLSGLDLRAGHIRAQCIQLVADYAAAHPGQPVWGHGWDESSWPENTPPSTADLDAVLGDRPAYLARVDVALRAGVDGAATAGRGIAVGSRVRPRRVRWPATRTTWSGPSPVTCSPAEQLAEARTRGAGRRRRGRRSSRCTNAPAPRSAGSMTGCGCATSTMACEVIGVLG